MPLTLEQQKIVEEWIPYVRKIALSFSGDDEVQSIALYALCRAALNYDETKRTPLKYYIAHRVKTRIYEYLLLRQKWPKHLDFEPEDKSLNLTEFLHALPPKIKQIMVDKYIGNYTDKELQEKYNIKPNRLNLIIRIARMRLIKEGV